MLFMKTLIAVAAAATVLTALPMTAAASVPTVAPAAKTPKGQFPYTPAVQPAPIPYTPGQLVFAQFNVCKTQCAAPAPDWDTRRPRVERVLASTTADVIGINEATNYSTSTAKTQWLDVQQIMADDGYVATRTTVDECERPRDANGQLAGESPCDHTTGILYKTATVKEITTPNGTPSSGATLVERVAPGVNAISGMREVNWGFLQAKDGSTPPFLVVSLHLSTVKDADYENSRVMAGQALTGWANAKIAEAGLPANTPVILLADLNSHAKRQPNGVQKVLADNGWSDAYLAAPKVINPRWSTVNETPQRPSWDSRGPLFYAYKKNPVTRIDYIMSRGAAPVQYETVMFLNADGTPIADYQASDHNAIRAVVKF